MIRSSLSAVVLLAGFAAAEVPASVVGKWSTECMDARRMGVSWGPKAKLVLEISADGALDSTVHAYSSSDCAEGTFIYGEKRIYDFSGSEAGGQVQSQAIQRELRLRYETPSLITRAIGDYPQLQRAGLKPGEWTAVEDRGNGKAERALSSMTLSGGRLAILGGAFIFAKQQP